MCCGLLCANCAGAEVSFSFVFVFECTEAICDHDQVSGGISVLIVANKQDVEVSATLLVAVHTSAKCFEKFVSKILATFCNILYNLCFSLAGSTVSSGPGDKLLFDARQHRTVPGLSHMCSERVSVRLACQVNVVV